METGVCDGGRRPGGAERPGGTAGRPGGTMGRAGTGSGDTGSDSCGVPARETPSGEGLVSDSTTTGEGERAEGVVVAGFVSFCLLVFVVAAGGFGVAGREDEAKDEVFVVVVFRSFVATAGSAPPLVVTEPERCWRAIVAVRRCCRTAELCIALV